MNKKIYSILTAHLLVVISCFSLLEMTELYERKLENPSYCKKIDSVWLENNLKFIKNIEDQLLDKCRHTQNSDGRHFLDEQQIIKKGTFGLWVWAYALHCIKHRENLDDYYREKGAILCFSGYQPSYYEPFSNLVVLRQDEIFENLSPDNKSIKQPTSALYFSNVQDGNVDMEKFESEVIYRFEKGFPTQEAVSDKGNINLLATSRYGNLIVLGDRHSSIIHLFKKDKNEIRKISYSVDPEIFKLKEGMHTLHLLVDEEGKTFAVAKKEINNFEPKIIAHIYST